MKICFFNSVKKWGGGEKWHLNVATAFFKAGHDVVIASCPESELEKKAKAAGIKTNTFNLSNLSFLNPFKQISILEFFRKEKFDVVIFNFSRDLKSGALCAKLAGIPKIIYRRGLDTAIKDNFVNRIIFKDCLTDVLANSEATKDSILKNNPNLFPREKIKVIYNGINIDTDNLSAVAHPAFTEATVDKTAKADIPIVGNLGRCVYQKGQDILLDVAAILKNRGVKCKFIIGGDGPLLKKLKEQSKSSGIDDMVEFVGFVENPNRFMPGIDIFALTSRFEGFGYVIAEAMVHNIPVVAFNISSNPELVSDGKNGLLVPFENKELFARALIDLINNKEKRKQFGDNGKKIVLEKFNFEKNVRKVMEYISNSYTRQNG